jgi:hypothetical protein
MIGGTNDSAAVVTAAIWSLRAATAAASRGRLTAVVEQADHIDGVCGESASGVGQADPPAGALEQVASQLPPQRGDR